jgi:hypothetical protein
MWRGGEGKRQKPPVIAKTPEVSGGRSNLNQNEIANPMGKERK